MFETSMPVRLHGTPYERGIGQQRFGGSTTQAVRDATIGRIEQARAEGLLDSAGEAYLVAQRQFAMFHDPQSMEELQGIADGFGIAEETLFEHLHLGILRDHKRCGGLDQDGCSAWAVASSAEGPIVVKNRDFSGSHSSIQRVFAHTGPDISTGSMLCVGSLGSPGAYSSGMNASGLALVDTQVGSRDHGIGWLRYFLMTRILAQCSNIEQALQFIRSRVHAGGGTLVMADKSGAVAAVELGHKAIGIQQSDQVWRSNHFVTPELKKQTFPSDGTSISKNSLDRYDVLKTEIPLGDWSVIKARSLMQSHRDDGKCGSLCQHPEGSGSLTISASIYVCTTGELYFCGQNPCISPWYHYSLQDENADRSVFMKS